MSGDGEEPERKRQRLEASEPLVMDVDSPAKWDFLAPWCEELKGQLVSIPGDFIRVLGPRSKREKPFRFDLEDSDEEEEAEEKVDSEEEEKEIEQALWRTREALELLSLVAKVDPRAFHMLMTQQCGLRLDDEDSEEEEEEFRPVIPGEGEDDFVFFDDEDSERGEQDDDDDDDDDDDATGDDGQGRNGHHRRTDRGDQSRAESDSDDAGAEDEDDNAAPNNHDGEERGHGHDQEEDEDEERDDVFVLPPDTLKSERRRERETFISPRFDFISLRNIPGEPEITGSLFAEWEKLFLADAPEYQPSAVYKEARQCILDMLPVDRKIHPRIRRSLEIPVSLEFSDWSKSTDELADHLNELTAFMEEMHHRARKVDSTAVQDVRDCASAYVYCLTQLSMTLSPRGNMTPLLVDRLLRVLGCGVLLSEIHMYLRDQATADSDPALKRDSLAKLLTGMLVRPASPTQTQLPSFSALNIDCERAAPWQFEALCSSLAVSQASVAELTLTGACNDRMKDELRRRYWKLLAQTFFHTCSSKQGPFSSVRGLRLPDAELTMDDVEEITAVLQEKEHQEKVAKQWSICRKSWLLRAGTLVHFTEMDGAERVLAAGDPAALPCDTPVELLESNSDNSKDDAPSESLAVIIPGYGQCNVSRDSVVAVSNGDPDKLSKPIGGPLTSLSLSFKSEAFGLPGLIQQIGWSLEKLSLSFHHEVDVNAMVATILSSCPRMTKLSLSECFIDLDFFSTMYESVRGPDGEIAPAVRTLKFQDYFGLGDGEGKLFMKRLGDPSTRLAKDLRELSLLADEYAEPLDHPTLSELWVALGNNTTLEKVEVMVSRTMMSAIWKRRLRQFHGQVLPPRPLPLPSKLAFLSVCHPSSVKKTSSAAHQLDRRVLSLIFEFAATRVVRSVKVW